MAEHIVIVCGYGCHLVPELKMYLDRVIRFCNQEKPDCLILCGGFSQQFSAPGASEARVMWDYVLPQLKDLPGRIHLEEQSYTTPDNIMFATAYMRSLGLLRKDTREDMQLTVFCEATRALKTDLLVRHFMGVRATIETASWELMSPQKQIISTLYDWAAIKFPPLLRYWHNMRLKGAKLA